MNNLMMLIKIKLANYISLCVIMNLYLGLYRQGKKPTKFKIGFPVQC